MANSKPFALGSHFTFSWKRLERSRGNYNWSDIDQALSRLGPGKTAILRVVVRCPIRIMWMNARLIGR